MTDPISTPSPTNDTQEIDMPLDVAGAARELGLKPVRAWVPDEKQKARSAGAERVRRCRTKAEQHGLKQLSITVPEGLHPVLKTLAARTKAGEQVESVLAELFPNPNFTFVLNDNERSNTCLSWVDALPAWRRWLLHWLLPKTAIKPNCSLEKRGTQLVQKST